MDSDHRDWRILRSVRFGTFVGRRGSHFDLARDLEEAGFFVQADPDDVERSLVKIDIDDPRPLGEIRGDAEAVVTAVVS